MFWKEKPIVTYTLECADNTKKTIYLPSFSKNDVQRYLDRWNATIKSSTISGNLNIEFNNETEEQLPDWVKPMVVL